MKSVHVVAYYQVSETVLENEAAESMAKLIDHVQSACSLTVTFETRPETVEHETNVMERDPNGKPLTGIRRPPRHLKELRGNRISMSFSRTLSCPGTGGLSDFCIRIDRKSHAPTLVHEFLHAIGLDPDRRESQPYAGKEIDDQNPEHHRWNQLLLREAEAEHYNIHEE